MGWPTLCCQRYRFVGRRSTGPPGPPEHFPWESQESNDAIFSAWTDVIAILSLSIGPRPPQLAVGMHGALRCLRARPEFTPHSPRPRALIQSDAQERWITRQCADSHSLNNLFSDDMASMAVRSTILKALPAGGTFRHAGLVSNQGDRSENRCGHGRYFIERFNYIRIAFYQCLILDFFDSFNSNILFASQSVRPAARRLSLVTRSVATTPAKVDSLSLVTKGEPNSMEFRIFQSVKGMTVSAWHDLPLFAGDGCFHFVCEIPKETSAKMELATDEAGNPIKQDTKKGKLRFYPYNIHWNYGMLPQTWEDPEHKNAECFNAGVSCIYQSIIPMIPMKLMPD
jgi:hypothetical protein